MSWHYSRALVEAYSEDCCTGGEPLPPLKSKTTHAEFYSNGKLTESYLDSLSGMMSAPSTASRGVARSMSSAEGSHAKTSVAPGKVKALLDLEAAYGERWQESFAKLDRETSSWKTHQCSLFGGLESFSETWPRWGSMRDGVCSERVMPEHHISGIVSGSGPNTEGLWPTPCQDASLRENKYAQGGMPLGMAIRMWPTPRAGKTTDEKEESWQIRKDAGKVSTPPLSLAVKMTRRDGGTKTRQSFPTPASNSGSGGCVGLAGGAGNRQKLYKMFGKEEGKKLGCQSLNPSWVEWLMGWPIGWTDLKPLAMDKFQQWLRSHGNCSKAPGE